MSNKYFRFYLKRDYQLYVIKSFDKYSDTISAIHQNYLTSVHLKISEQRAYQFILMIIIQYLFGLFRCKLISILNSRDAQILKKYIRQFGK